MMQPPCWTLHFELLCGASGYVVGVILGQRKKGKPFVIYYTSKTLNSIQNELQYNWKRTTWYNICIEIDSDHI